MKIDGNEYKLGAGVILNVKHDLPIVGVIQDIFIVKGNKVFSLCEPVFNFMNHTIGLTYWKKNFVQE